MPVPGQTGYGASKAALHLLFDGLHSELMDTNVHVTLVFPGAVGTDIAAYHVLFGNDAKMMDVLTRIAPKRAARMMWKQMRSLLAKAE